MNAATAAAARHFVSRKEAQKAQKGRQQQRYEDLSCPAVCCDSCAFLRPVNLNG